MNLCFQKEKTWRKCVFTTTPYMHIIIYFTSLFYPYIQIPYILQISLHGDKNVAFDFWDAWLFGHPVYNYFNTQDLLLRFSQTCEL